MQGRLLAFFLPVFLLTALVLGTLLAVESARNISLDAAAERNDAVDELQTRLIGELTAGNSIGPILINERSQTHLAYATLDGSYVPTERKPSSTVEDRIAAALPGDSTVWPWTDGDFVSTTATAVDGVPLELVVVDSTDPVRAAITRRWTIIVAAVLSAVALIAAGTYPLTRWALRPIRQLDDTAQALANGDMSARANVGRGAPELRQLATSFNTMAERVNAGLHRERAFVASASHHFGNLLTPLRLRVETIDRSDPTVDEALAELDRLEAAAERLLQLNRAEEDDFQPAVVDVGAIVEASVQSWEFVADANQVELRREGSESAMALAVSGAIEETLDNLIDNAMKYAEGSPITVRVLRGLHNVRVTVSDRGPGMTDLEMEQAQGRFWRGPTQQNKPGSGLGLSIVDALATQCGGTFEMRNGPDGGLEAGLVLKRATEA